MTEVEFMSKGRKRRVDFICPECGLDNVKWANKQPERDAEKNINKVIVYCSRCEAMFSIDPFVEKE